MTPRLRFVGSCRGGARRRTCRRRSRSLGRAPSVLRVSTGPSSARSRTRIGEYFGAMAHAPRSMSSSSMLFGRPATAVRLRHGSDFQWTGGRADAASGDRRRGHAGGRDAGAHTEGARIAPGEGTQGVGHGGLKSPSLPPRALNEWARLRLSSWLISFCRRHHHPVGHFGEFVCLHSQNGTGRL